MNPSAHGVDNKKAKPEVCTPLSNGISSHERKKSALSPLFTKLCAFHGGRGAFSPIKSFRQAQTAVHGRFDPVWSPGIRSPRITSLSAVAGHQPARRGGSRALACYCWLSFLAASNSSPGCQPATSGSAAARWPSANPNCAIFASPVKSHSAWYSSLG